MTGTKIHQRIGFIVYNAIFSLAPGLGNQLFSILINRYFFPQWWGMIVELQLIQYITTAFVAWGNKEFLTRQFGQFPNRKYTEWNRSFGVRFFLLLFPSIIILSLCLPSISFIHVAIWITCRYITQSFESVITYQKKFKLAVYAEIVSALFISAGIVLMFESITFNSVLLLITLSNIIRALIYLVVFRPWLYPSEWLSISTNLLKDSSPFMFLAFTGLVQTKVDLALIDAWMPKSELARYHVFSNFLILIRMGPAFLIYPFLSNLYRFDIKKIEQTSRWLLLIGTVISIVGLLILAAMMHYVYHMPHELNWYVWGFLACLPGYWFGPFVFYLFKGKREKKVITANLVGIFVSVGVLLLTISSYGISGAIAATAIAQIAMLAYYYLIFKSKLKPINSNLQTK